jgi:LDH2 family malate/lactate/ureidoglycolate dehydrogenase
MIRANLARPVAATKATQIAIIKAKKYATAAVGVHNLNHVGHGGDV